MIVQTRSPRRVQPALVSIALCSVLGWALPLHAQVSGGTISGTVRDEGGGVIPGASLSVANVATGVARDVTSNASGFYTAPNLVSGVYQVTASVSGMAKAVTKGIRVTVGGEQTVDLVMKVGGLEQSVEVTGATPVDQSSSALSGVVDSRQIVELPLNGRDWTSLATLQPGVANIRTQPALAISNQRANRGLGAQLTISGNRPQQNNYRLDGISINDYSNGAPGSVLGVDLGVDAVQEFSVVTSNAPANYGKSSGGILNAVTRSGTNTIHGDAYEFHRRSGLDSRNFFDGPTIPPFTRNQFGASLGMPLRKDRTFIFGDYEGLRQDLGVTLVNTVPSAAARTGQLAAGLVSVDPRVVPYLPFYPLPNGAVSGDTGVFSFAGQQVTHQDFFTVRLDHTVSVRNNLAATYFYDNGMTTGPDSFDLRLIGTRSRRQAVILQDSHTFGASLFNTVRAGFSRVVSQAPTTLAAIDPRAADTSLGFAPGLPVGLINIAGISNFQGGLGAVGEFDFHYNSFQIYDDGFLTRGKHALKFGVAAERILSDQLGTANPNGQFIFGSLAAFLTDRPTSFNAPISTNVTPRNLRQTLVGAYVMDDWRARRNLTINLGLRYEIATVPTEVDGKLSTLATLTDGQPRLGSPYFKNPTKLNFSPRLGFSWDPFSNGRTAVHGAFGVYDHLPLPYEFELLSLLSAPFFTQGNVVSLAPGTFPTGAYPLLTSNRLRYGIVEQNPKRNYVMQWNLNVQREVVSNLTVTVGYVGSRGVHQPFHVDDVNIVLPTLTPAGYVWPSPRGSGTRLNPNLGQISANFWSASSSYHALNVQVTKAMSHGLQLQGSYTFSKSIDTSSSGLAGDTFGNSVSSLPFFDPSLRRGLSDFDVRHLAVLNYTWVLPSPSSSGLLGWLAGGWQLGGIYQASSGLPFTAIIGGDPLGLSSADTFAFPDRLTGSGCASAVNPGNATHYIKTECFAFPSPGTRLGTSGRNTLIGPGLSNLDLSIFKNNRIKRAGDAFNVQLRLEIFNVLNRVNLNNPTNANRQIFNAAGAPLSNAGLLTSTSTPARQMQLGVKMIW